MGPQAQGTSEHDTRYAIHYETSKPEERKEELVVSKDQSQPRSLFSYTNTTPTTPTLTSPLSAQSLPATALAASPPILTGTPLGARNTKLSNPGIATALPLGGTRSSSTAVRIDMVRCVMGASVSGEDDRADSRRASERAVHAKGPSSSRLGGGTPDEVGEVGGMESERTRSRD